jgi:serine protease Do
VPNGDQKSLITFKDFVARGIQKSYKPVGKIELKPTGPPPYHGIVFVPDLLPRTPPYVDRVRSNSPAAIAGIQPDDLISFVDGEPVSSIRLFQDIIRRSQVNQTLRIEVRRGTRLMTLEVKLASSTQR